MQLEPKEEGDDGRRRPSQQATLVTVDVDNCRWQDSDGGFEELTLLQRAPRTSLVER